MEFDGNHLAIILFFGFLAVILSSILVYTGSFSLFCCSNGLHHCYSSIEAKASVVEPNSTFEAPGACREALSTLDWANKTSENLTLEKYNETVIVSETGEKVLDLD